MDFVGLTVLRNDSLNQFECQLMGKTIWVTDKFLWNEVMVTFTEGSGKSGVEWVGGGGCGVSVGLKKFTSQSE